MNRPDFETFRRLALTEVRGGGLPTLLPMYRRLFSDALTPVLAYRRLVAQDARLAPSFLFESVEDGARIGRYSFMGARPVMELIARGHEAVLRDHRDPTRNRSFRCDDPLAELDRLSRSERTAVLAELPTFTGGWVGCAGYDVVRYLEPEKLPWPPPDDRGLPDLHMQLYHDVVAFDHVRKTALVITHVAPREHESLEAAYEAGSKRLTDMVHRLATPRVTDSGGEELPAGDVDLTSPPPKLPVSSMGEGGYQRAVERCKQYIAAGDAFQIVPSQRFELRTAVDPFDVYRALRVVNPSPYMFYLQIEGAILVGSSPEILCRVEDGRVTSRPLAGTRRRGRDAAEDAALERELREDPKDVAEHVMLVDLHRNDVGRVAVPGSIELPRLLTVERYSHVMHLSSTVTGRLREGLTCWDALRVTLPVGTVSGAPKVRAMQIIDELEPTRRGPYGGAVGYADLAGNMDMAIALRTMVVLPGGSRDQGSGRGVQGDRAGANVTSATAADPRSPNPEPWIVHLQAGGGIVADSQPQAEFEETVNKAAALAKAVAVAEQAFHPAPASTSAPLERQASARR